MKFSFSTLGCPNWSFEKILGYAKENDLGIEIRGIGPYVDIADLTEFKPEHIAETKELIAESGARIIALGTSAYFDGRSLLPDMLSEVQASVDIAGELGISILRIFGDRIWDQRFEPEILRVAGSGIKAACKLAEGTDIRLGIEVHGNFDTIEKLKWLVDYVDSPAFGIIWDIEHTGEIDYRRFYEDLKPYIFHLHLKDNTRLCKVPDGRGELVLPGDGVLMDTLMPFLADSGYDGYASFEWEKRHHQELAEPEIAFARFLEYVKPYR